MKNNYLKLFLFSCITFGLAEASTQGDDDNPFERGMPGSNRGISLTTIPQEKQEGVNDKKRKINLLIEIPQNSFFSNNKSPTNSPFQKKKRENPLSSSVSSENDGEEEFRLTVKTPDIECSFSMSSPLKLLLSPISSPKILSPFGMWWSYPDGTPFTPGFSPRSPIKSPLSLRKSEFRNIIKQAEEGDHQAQLECAQYFYNPDKTGNPDFEKAAYWLKKSADQGNASAAYELAELYEQGKILGKDIHDAIFYYEKGAQGNDIDSIFMLGRIHHVGHGIEVDIPKAISWYEKAITLGHIQSAVDLGEIYLFNEGFQDYDKAFKYLKLCDNNPFALFYLGQMHMKGLGISQNYSKAIECFEKCLRKDEDNELNLREEIISSLSDLFSYDAEKSREPFQELSGQTLKTFSGYKEHVEEMLNKLMYRHGLEVGQARHSGWNDNILFDDEKVSLFNQLLIFESKVQTILSQMNDDGFLIDIVEPKFDERTQGQEVPYYEFFQSGINRLLARKM